MSIEYKPMLCPVCKDFYFSDLQEGDEISTFQCFRCGWRYDLYQVEHPEHATTINPVSLIDAIKIFQQKKKDNPNYDYFEENIPGLKPHACPVCHKHMFKDESSFEICPFCGWEDDGTETDNTIGANEMSFSEYIAAYQKKINENPKYKWKNK